MDIWHFVAILIGGYFLRKIYSLFKGYKREIKDEKFNHLDQKKIGKELRNKRPVHDGYIPPAPSKSDIEKGYKPPSPPPLPPPPKPPKIEKK